MKRIKEILRGNNTSGFEFLSKQGTGNVSFNGSVFRFSHPLESGAIGYKIVYVNTNATGEATGDSWKNAYTTMEQAFEAVSGSPIEIRIAKGEYELAGNNNRLFKASYFRLLGGLDPLLEGQAVRTGITKIKNVAGITGDIMRFENTMPKGDISILGIEFSGYDTNNALFRFTNIKSSISLMDVSFTDNIALWGIVYIARPYSKDLNNITLKNVFVDNSEHYYYGLYIRNASVNISNFHMHNTVCKYGVLNVTTSNLFMEESTFVDIASNTYGLVTKQTNSYLNRCHFDLSSSFGIICPLGANHRQDGYTYMPYEPDVTFTKVYNSTVINRGTGIDKFIFGVLGRDNIIEINQSSMQASTILGLADNSTQGPATGTVIKIAGSALYISAIDIASTEASVNIDNSIDIEDTVTPSTSTEGPGIVIVNLGTNVSLDDPMFTDASNGNLHLQVTSPGIDFIPMNYTKRAEYFINFPSLEYDITGTSRFAGDPSYMFTSISIGAFAEN